VKSIRSRAPAASSSVVRRVMQANVGRETAPERCLRSALQRRGLRFRKDYRPVTDLRCKADIVFVGRRVCVFVDGCFWHGCTEHFEVPKANRAWWQEKVDANIERDVRQTAELSGRGWKVLRFWEHEVAGASLADVVSVIAGTLKARAGEPLPEF